MLQKVLAALASGSYPDVAYIFGSDLANVARSPKVVDMTDTRRPAVRTTGRRSATAVTVNGQVRAAPALLDSLAVVCNKALFAPAGLPLPEDGWRWRDFVDHGKALTDADAGTFGTGWPGAGDEDTVWRLWPLVWDAGRRRRRARTGAASGSPTRACVRCGWSRTSPATGVSTSTRSPAASRCTRCSCPAGWAWWSPGRGSCRDITDAGIDYHVVPLPSFSGTPGHDLGPGHVDAVRQRRRRGSRPPARSCSWLIAAGTGRALGHRVPAACR